MSSSLKPFAPAVLLFGLTSCVSVPPSLGAQCERNAECQTPYVCRLARCRTECASQRDCPIGSLCLKDEHGLGACRLPDEATCATDDQCAGSLSCIDDACTQGCGEMDPCAPLAVCVVSPEGAHCENPLGTGCVDSTMCPDGYRCSVEGRCEPRCNQNRDCPIGMLCEGGTCVANDGGLPMDGAMDASDASMDASGDGSTDASTDGSADGSTDASTDGSMDGSPDASTDGSTDAAADSGVACTSPSDCTAANVMTADCVSGFCTIVTCTSGFDDCDADFATGCETDLALPASCGACGADCGLGGVCTSGTCDRVVGVTVAIETACFTRSSGSVYCVGRNDHGELGIGTTGADSRVLSQVMMLTNGASASAGAHSTCIARGDGTAACIGANDVGQIGNGTMTSASFPRAVSSLTGVTRVATGGLLANNGFACALHTGGAVSCWGHQNGRGDGMLGNTNIPVAVSGLTDAIDLGAGGLFACAVRTGGSVVCWGAAGPWLGPAGTTSRLTPTAVTGITDATRIDADQQHACAVRSTGAVACWGDNNAGRLGADPTTTTESATPVAVPGITDAVDVDVGGLTSCALRAGGTVKCWGFGGAAGALGGGATGISFTPVDVIGLTTASALSTGSFASCVLRTDGSVACWGTNELYIGAGPLVAVGWPVPTTHPLFPPTP